MRTKSTEHVTEKANAPIASTRKGRGGPFTPPWKTTVHPVAAAKLIVISHLLQSRSQSTACRWLSLSIASARYLTRIRLQSAIYFRLHRGSLPENTEGGQPRFAGAKQRFPGTPARAKKAPRTFAVPKWSDFDDRHGKNCFSFNCPYHVRLNMIEQNNGQAPTTGAPKYTSAAVCSCQHLCARDILLLCLKSYSRCHFCAGLDR